MNDMRVPVKHPQQRVAPQETPAHQLRARKRRAFLVPAVVVIVALAALVSTLYWFTPKSQAIDTNSYQVVYLTSGQAYFGKLKSVSGEYLVIDTPYTAQDAKPSDDKTTNPQTTLIKVSNQLYGPTDSIAIRASQVSFWQNLRSDSKVVQAIKSKQ